ncbi:T9SS type A sorting domain-containing protein [Flavobacterium sp. CYK-4]|uniref:T9SS type A sorting domain-containing protein n=1 Tax=Flavobacterium lotistagni TaxID=2709660 RepID=UPI0014073644|nr:T9SS type A sorting domain-containing protein [Flavobacterium lotistagni]NHM06071.1 T9SS type A sorting domain-containing protein [Flavobacterium lotistagni]
MKTKISCFLCLLFFFNASALHIARVNISQLEKNLKVRIDTQAAELYYFQTWQYSVEQNTITIEALFISGFGSAIDYLHNEFELPLILNQPDFYRLIVKAFYGSYQPEQLQDKVESAFSVPFSSPLFLFDQTLNTTENIINPSSGELLIDAKISHVFVFDISGKYVANLKNNQGKIPLDQLADGIYIVGYFREQRYKTIRVILKKQ